jgi:hypothetical protein
VGHGGNGASHGETGILVVQQAAAVGGIIGIVLIRRRLGAECDVTLGQLIHAVADGGHG